jgi:hypothetical protein
MLRRQYFRDNGLLYDPDYRHIEDFELWGRAMQYMQFANIQKVLLDYRISTGQVCTVYAEHQRTAIAPLRLKFLKELGIEPTEDEWKLHEMIMNGNLPHVEKLLKAAETWLLYLEQTNRTKGIYLPESFSHRLLQIWFSICSDFSSTHSCSLWRCLSSKLWSTTPNFRWYKLRALAAWTTGCR